MVEREHDGPVEPSKPAGGTGANAPDAPDAKRDKAGTPEQLSAASAGTPMTQQVGRVVLIAAAVLFGVFAVFNFQYVDFSWVFGDTTVVKDNAGDRLRGGVPLIVLLLSSFVLGALVAWISTLRSERRKRKRPE